MSSVVIDTNPLAYIYSGIPDLGKKYAHLLGDLKKSNTLLINPPSLSAKRRVFSRGGPVRESDTSHRSCLIPPDKISY
jgi:hypothetical protein